MIEMKNVEWKREKNLFENREKCYDMIWWMLLSKLLFYSIFFFFFLIFYRNVENCMKGIRQSFWIKYLFPFNFFCRCCCCCFLVKALEETMFNCFIVFHLCHFIHKNHGLLLLFFFLFFYFSLVVEWDVLYVDFSFLCVLNVKYFCLALFIYL